MPSADDLRSLALEPVAPSRGRIYIAVPFFNLAERWMAEEVYVQLTQMGIDVFSPLHHDGSKPGKLVGPLDLAGLDGCRAVIALLNGADPGTVFEVGYARARGLPVVVLAQNMRSEDLKMFIGSGCRIVGDLVSAIYHAVWALP